MQMQKGICLELNKDRSVFILKDGRFVEGRPADEAAVGEEAYFFPKVKKAKSRVGMMLAPAVLAAAILMLVLSTVLPSNEAYAYVQIEVNPSIEMGIDENFRVVSLRELNKDGLEVISKIKDWENLSVDEVLEKAILLSLRESTEEVTITTVVTGDEKESLADLEAAVLAVSAKVAKEKLEVHLKEASPEQWRKSIKENVPVGQKVEDFKVFEESSKTKETPADSKPPLKEKSKQKDPVKAPPDSSEQNKENLAPEQEKKATAPERSNRATPPIQEKKQTPTGQDKKKTTPPGQEKKQTPPGQEKKKATPPGQEKKQTPPGQEKKQTPPGQEKKKATPPGQEKKQIPPGQEKKKATPPGQEKKQTPPGQEKKKAAPPGQEKKQTPPGQEKKKATPPGQEKKQTPPGQEKKKAAPPGQEKKQTPPGQDKKNPDGQTGNNKGKNGKE
ncbi:hypothetical protein [Planococcus sp. 107-1]|uniref:anti-sigma-I factor RsgI family protein n=1 Tax=Planococcus sp. 107-1 TaxID=2908840 RepID=UPI001F382E84|nr:hypothetical protein [Planococcus sp. 107-1]UJF25907.1 hypothetical protein L0M13_11975 [Planococcus sp. 107-1]